MPVHRVLPLAVAVVTASFGLAHAVDANFFPPEIVPPAAKLDPLAEPCMKEFTHLRGKADRDGGSFLNAARENREGGEMCRLARAWAQSEVDAVRYVEAQGASCGILVQSAVRYIQSRSMAESLQNKVCAGDDSWIASLPAAKPSSVEDTHGIDRQP